MKKSSGPGIPPWSRACFVEHAVRRNAHLWPSRIKHARYPPIKPNFARHWCSVANAVRTSSQRCGAAADPQQFKPRRPAVRRAIESVVLPVKPHSKPKSKQLRSFHSSRPNAEIRATVDSSTNLSSDNSCLVPDATGTAIDCDPATR